MKSLRYLQRVLCGACVTALLPITTYAGTNVFDFNTDPASILTVYRQGTGGGIWYSTNGAPGGSVNPATNGYFAITDEVNSQNAAIIFDDFDNGLVVKAFSFSMDVRVGRNSGSQPADGFSISYARSFDPVILNGDGTGFANGVGSASGSVPEEGTTTGLAIIFDAFNNLQETPGADVIGLSVRVDNVIITNVPMPTANGACSNILSMQTGNGPLTSLCWQPLYVNLDDDGTLDVSYKGVFFLTNFPTSFSPSAGRLILAGRTGGENQNQHVDNIRIVTVPANSPAIGQPIGSGLGFKLLISDSGPATPDTNTMVVRLDGNIITPNSITKDGAFTTILYQNPAAPLAPGSSHSVRLTFSGTGFSQVDETKNFTAPNYTLLTTSHDAPAAVNTTLSGFSARVHQLPFGRGTSLINVERQLADRYLDAGTGQPYANSADISAANPSGRFDLPGVINWNQDMPTGVERGTFTSFRPAPANFTDEPIPGIPGTDPANANENVAAEILTVLDLPAGYYQLAVLSDDSLKLTAGAEPRDVFAPLLASNTSADVETVGSFAVTNSGLYPFRLVYGEATGGAQLEFYLVDFLTGTKVLINDRTNSIHINAYRDVAALTQPYVQFTSPAPGETGVSGSPIVTVAFKDGTAGTVTDGSIRLFVNGVGGTPTIANSGTTTTATLPSAAVLPANSTNTAMLVYSTSLGASVTNTWQFTVGSYITLPVGLRTPPGSGDATKPGFRVKTWQMDASLNVQLINDNTAAELLLLGRIGTNAADLASFTNSGEYVESGPINWRSTGSADRGFLTAATGYPDAPIPGLPGAGANTTDNTVVEAEGFLEFPAAGFYSMGVVSDDGFRVSLGDTSGPNVPVVEVLAPAGVAGRLAAMPTVGTLGGGGSFGGPIPFAGIEAPLVIADPLLAGTALSNAAAVAGKIVYTDRGTFGFAVKALNAQNAGAVAIIIANATIAGGTPISMGGTDGTVTIPCFMVSQATGNALKAVATTSANSPVIVRINRGDTRMILGELSGGRGADLPGTTFGLNVPQAGVYPFRLMYENGGGDASVEWFAYDAGGSPVAINGTNAAALKSFRARTVAGGAPTLGRPTAAGGNVTVSWTGVGELQESAKPTGPWGTAANQDNPQTVPANQTQRYLRVRQY